jgi:hypothetical protein
MRIPLACLALYDLLPEKLVQFLDAIAYLV